MLFLFVVLTFVLVLGIIIGVYWYVVAKPENTEQTALRKRLKASGRKSAIVAADGLLKIETPLSGIGLFDAALRASTRISKPAGDLIERAGMDITVGTLVLLCGVCGIAVYAIVQTVTHLSLLSLVLALLAALAPIPVIQMKAAKRTRQFEEQFPEAIDLLSRALKAGHAFTTGMSMVAEEMPEPVGPEFRLVYDRQNFGMPLAEALRIFGQRIPLLDAKFFVTAVLTQRDAGGNLSEVLDNLAKVIRERFRVKRQVRVITAHARMTGWVLALLPPTLALVLTMLAPQHMSLLWTDPRGIKMVMVALVLQVSGALIIRKLVNVEY
jgi:tight adherence protein B